MAPKSWLNTSIIIIWLQNRQSEWRMGCFEELSSADQADWKIYPAAPTCRESVLRLHSYRSLHWTRSRFIWIITPPPTTFLLSNWTVWSLGWYFWYKYYFFHLPCWRGSLGKEVAFHWAQFDRFPSERCFCNCRRNFPWRTEACKWSLAVFYFLPILLLCFLVLLCKNIYMYIYFFLWWIFIIFFFRAWGRDGGMHSYVRKLYKSRRHKE